MVTMAAEVPAVLVQGLRKSFAEHEVLRGVDLTVAAGEVVAIIGSSGSGKSTLLRCINALETPTEGNITISGEQLWPLPLHLTASARARHLTLLRTRVGMVFQRFNLFPHRTAVGNVMEGLLAVRRLEQREARDRAMAMLDRMGLRHRADAYPSQLSGGQQQRVAIARALVMEPQVMLFDEATSALDPELKGEVLAVMTQLAGGGLTMLVVTHEMNFARDVAHRVAFVDQGIIAEQGAAREFFASPTTERSRSFLQMVAAS
jgi:polar amino acid transport system ATP-binding protein